MRIGDRDVAPRVQPAVAAQVAAAGLSFAAALPPFGWWPLSFVGVVLVDRLLADEPRGARFARGFWTGLFLLCPTFFWMAHFTKPGYVIAVLFYAALLGLALMAVPPHAPARWLALPASLVAWDAVRGRWPFGGVPISTVALGQTGSPLVWIVRVGGPLLLTFVVGCAGVALSALLRRRWAGAAVAAAAVVVALVLAAVAPRAHDLGTITVGIVQGGGVQGTSIEDVPPSVVFQRHLTASRAVPVGLDLVLWPEDVVETDGRLEANPEGVQVADLARALDTTLVVGAVEDEGTTRFHNSAIAYGPDGAVVDRYEKVRRVPFGEYTPFRWLLEPLGGGSVRQSDAIVGHDPATLTTAPATIGVSISWEIWFADRARAAIRDGGEILTNPTNGASFQGKEVQSQQLASTRMRAIETDRWALQAAPTGFSAIITADGHVVEKTAIGEQRVLTGTIQRRAGLTWAVRVGDWPALLLTVGGYGAAWATSRRRDQRAEAAADAEEARR